MSAAPRAVAVTGASGFLGRALCRHLAARGIEVRPLVRDPAGFSLAGTARRRAATCPTRSTSPRSQAPTR